MNVNVPECHEAVWYSENKEEKSDRCGAEVPKKGGGLFREHV